jgi:AraC-like DNA-binding protein
VYNWAVHAEHFVKQRTLGGVELFHYPTRFAQRVWFYVRAIGKSRHDPSFRQAHRNEDGYLLHFVKRGALWHRINGTDHSVQRGEACLFGLTNEVSYGTKGDGAAEFYWVWFNGKEMPAVFEELQADHDPAFPSLDLARMESLFRELLSLTERKPAAYEARASASLTSVLAELQASRFPARPVVGLDKGRPSARKLHGGFPALPGVASDAEARPLSGPVRYAIYYIRRFYEEPLSVKQIAGSAAHQSVSHFSRLFAREVGMPPSVYLNRFRVEQAKRLLENTVRPIEEVARSVGFIDQAYFARVFSRVAGMSPRQYRRKSQRAMDTDRTARAPLR